ncbi:MAG: ribonuclease III [Roseiflexaceae bacterium]
MLRPVTELPAVLGVSFNDISLLRGAVMHTSYRYEHPLEAQQYPDTQRMEFLGDSVVNIIATQLVYATFASADEGSMTRLRSALIRTENLASIAQQYNLGDYVILTKGEENAGARNRISLLADVCESVVAAIYLDQGLECARTFLLPHFTAQLATMQQQGTPTDPRSALQEESQRRYNITPTYRTIEASGPDHQRHFVVEVLIGHRVVGCGTGHSQATARLNAAQRAMNTLRDQADVPS